MSTNQRINKLQNKFNVLQNQFVDLSNEMLNIEKKIKELQNSNLAEKKSCFDCDFADLDCKVKECRDNDYLHYRNYKKEAEKNLIKNCSKTDCTNYVTFMYNNCLRKSSDGEFYAELPSQCMKNGFNHYKKKVSSLDNIKKEKENLINFLNQMKVYYYDKNNYVSDYDLAIVIDKYNNIFNEYEKKIKKLEKELDDNKKQLDKLR